MNSGLDRRLYTWAAMAALGIVFAGFARTYFLKTSFGTPALSTLIHVHGFLMTLWFLFFLMQVRLVAHVQRGLFDIAKIQTIAVLITFALGGVLLEWLGISKLYLPLLYIDVVGAALQVVLLGILNVLFYLDQRRAVVLLTATLPLTNILFTAISLQLGAAWFGYGFALAMLVTVLLGIWILNRKLEALEYQTFMLQ